MDGINNFINNFVNNYFFINWSFPEDRFSIENYEKKKSLKINKFKNNKKKVKINCKKEIILFKSFQNCLEMYSLTRACQYHCIISKFFFLIAIKLFL